MTQTREILRQTFIATTKWANDPISLLAGDASNRKYFRIHSTPSVVLMDADPQKGEDIKPFVKITNHLNGIGLKAPEIHTRDEKHGFMIIGDLGDDLYARVLDHFPCQELELYQAATDVLLHLHMAPKPSGLSDYDAGVMTDLSALSYDWYRAATLGPSPDRRAGFVGAFKQLLSTLEPYETVLIQRDYHAENLLWLPQNNEVQRVGLLDFQDAMLGHPAYDLVSLLQDARRDVHPAVEQDMIAYYLAQSSLDSSEFRKGYDLMGIQRNLRILGVFARLCIRDSKEHYVDLIPRVWNHLKTGLSKPQFAELADHLLVDLPEPSRETLDRLKSQCGQGLNL